MKIEFRIEECDYLEYQLFGTLKSSQIKKRSQLNKMIIPLLLVFVGFFDLVKGEYLFTIVYFSLALLWTYFYPQYERRNYVNYFKKSIKENYGKVIGRAHSLEIDSDFLTENVNLNVSKVSTKELEEINEIPSLIILKLEGNYAILLPKRDINNIENVRAELVILCENLGIEYNRNDNWKWT